MAMVWQEFDSAHVSVYSNSMLIFSSHMFCILLSQVDSSWSVEDYEGAQQAARNAKRWNIAAIITGVVLAVLGGLASVVQIVVHIR